MKIDKVKTPLHGDSHALYANMVISLLNRLIADGTLETEDDIDFMASQMETNKNAREHFLTIVRNCVVAKNFHIQIAKPADEKLLQTVDFVSWAYWRKYEIGDAEYASIVEKKLIAEYDYKLNA